MTTEHVDVVVVGGGVVGVAAALALARRGASVVLLEARPGLALQATVQDPLARPVFNGQLVLDGLRTAAAEGSLRIDFSGPAEALVTQLHADVPRPVMLRLYRYTPAGIEAGTDQLLPASGDVYVASDAAASLLLPAQSFALLTELPD